MPLPFLIGAAAVGIGSVMGAATKAVNRDYEEELDSIHQNMNRLAQQTEDSSQKTQRQTEYKLDRLAIMKETIYNESMKDFVDNFKKIKNVEITKSEELQNKIENLQGLVKSYHSNATSNYIKTEKEAAIKGAVLGSLFGGTYVVSGLIKGVKLQYAIEEAEAEYARLKVESEEVKRKETKLKSIGKRADEIYNVTNTLDRLFRLAINEMVGIMETAGKNYKSYSEQQRKQIFVTVQFAEAIKKIMDVPVVSKTGGVERESAKVLRSTKELIEQRS